MTRQDIRHSKLTHYAVDKGIIAIHNFVGVISEDDEEGGKKKKKKDKDDGASDSSELKTKSRKGRKTTALLNTKLSDSDDSDVDEKKK